MWQLRPTRSSTTIQLTYHNNDNTYDLNHYITTTGRSAPDVAMTCDDDTSTTQPSIVAGNNTTTHDNNNTTIHDN